MDSVNRKKGRAMLGFLDISPRVIAVEAIHWISSLSVVLMVQLICVLHERFHEERKLPSY